MKQEQRHTETDPQTLRHFRWLAGIFILCMTGITVLSFLYAQHKVSAQTELINQALSRAGHELTLNIHRYEFIPYALSLDETIRHFLSQQNDSGLQGEVVRKIRSIQNKVGALSVFITNADGKIIAASQQDLTGHDVQFRPYFVNSTSTTTEHFFGIGTTGSVAGYYQANAVISQGKKLGVVVVKIDIEALANSKSNYLNKLFLLDNNNIIVSSSDESLLFHSLGTLSPQQIAATGKTHKYNNKIIPPLSGYHARKISVDSYHVRFRGRDYIQINQYLPQLNLTLAQLSPVDSVYSSAAIIVALTGVTLAIIFTIISLFIQRQHIIRLKLDNQQALESAYSHLEELVQERSRQLEIQNASLAREVRERILSVQKMETMQQELIRTEKLAVIGQLSAGIAHEINQPLSAISVLSANSVRFLEQGKTDILENNLKRIVELVGFIGRISQQLRSFSRNGDDLTGAVSVSVSIDNALIMLTHRINQQHIRFERQAPPGEVWCLCNSTRLEQVLVNLLSNSIEAIGSQRKDGTIRVRWSRQGCQAVLAVEDNGPGIAPEILKNIFEPFFTTRTRNGLGLGLAISADIVHSYGGTLQAENLSSGACFTLRLPLATADDKETIDE